MKILITGTAGFIGFHLVSRLIQDEHAITGLDSINDYYDVNLKYSRLKEHGIHSRDIDYNHLVESNEFPGYRFVQLDLSDKDNLFNLFEHHKFDKVIHLAAQAGVRYSLTHPDAYLKSNWEGFLNILEACRHFDVKHLVYASSSSVYGLNEKMPFSENDNVDHPISLYAASKKSNELMAHTYSYLFNLPTTGLRFFTVYGPWGRPDMALFKFTKAILNDEPIDVYNQGEMQRDFTYIDDIVDGISKVARHTPVPNKDWSGETPDPFSSVAPYKVYNIGNSSPVHLMDFIHAIEESLGKEAQKNYLPLQPGDVPKTWADVENLKNDMGYQPTTSVKEGVKRFIDWYRDYYQV
ncbi:MAG: NAD-dependent epimerase [Bacteroidales bacterium]